MSLFTTFRNKVESIAAPVVGGLVGGLVGAPELGAVLGTSLMGSVGTGSSAPGMPGGTFGSGVTMPGGGGAGGGMIQTGAGGTWTSPASKWLISAKGIVSTVTGKLLGVMQGTKLIRLPAIYALARAVGMQAAAVALGLAVAEVAQLIAAHFTQRHGRRRRGRGISAHDVRVTRRTMHKIRSIEHSLHGICPPRRTSARRAPAAFVRQG